MKLTRYIATLFAIALVCLPHAAFSQSRLPKEGGLTISLLVLIVAVALIGFGLLYFRRKKASGADKAGEPEMSSFDRKMHDYLDAATMPRAAEAAAEQNVVVVDASLSDADRVLSAQLYQIKLRKMQFDQLPINAVRQIAEAKRFDLLPLSDDRELLAAIEQSQEDVEPDETVRLQTVDTLAEHKTRNSVDALAQLAIYDLSSNVRAKAVSTLAAFDHESVFEAILLACADPTREVRAAAARALFGLSFDRAEAWKRIIATRDDYRMIQAARAAMEAGLVERSFERLLHEDMKTALDSLALVALLIHAGETDPIFETLNSTKDERVQMALLHVLSVVQDERAVEKLEELQKSDSLPADVRAKLEETIESFELVPA